MKRIAILYICTGNYTVFWRDFHRTAEKFFLPDRHREYFVFTDGELKDIDEHVHVIYQENLGWPKNTLMRYEMFQRIIDRLKTFDYIYFFNANVSFCEPIGSEFLPENEGLLAVIHPGFYLEDRKAYLYETNLKSTAYISENEGQYYFMGGVNGGKSENYIKLINCISEQINKDLENGIIAVWHDESQINRYLIGKKVKVMSSSYGYPENWNLPFEKKILIREKGNYGGHAFLRGEKISLLQRIRNIFKN